MGRADRPARCARRGREAAHRIAGDERTGYAEWPAPDQVPDPPVGEPLDLEVLVMLDAAPGREVVARRRCRRDREHSARLERRQRRPEQRQEPASKWQQAGVDRGGGVHHPF